MELLLSLSTTLSQNGLFSTKESGQFRGLTKDALLHSHVNRVTFSLTSTLPMANPGCPVCSHRGGMAGSSAWRCKVIADNMLRRCRPPPTPCFRWRCGGDRSRPPALAGGGGKLAV